MDICIDNIAENQGKSEKLNNKYRSNNPDFQIRKKPDCITNNNGKRYNLIREPAICKNARKSRRRKSTKQINLKLINAIKRIENPELYKN